MYHTSPKKHGKSEFRTWNTAEFRQTSRSEFLGSPQNLMPIQMEVQKYEV